MKKTDNTYNNEGELTNSPLLSELKGKNSFDVPDAYFDKLEQDIMGKTVEVKSYSIGTAKKVIYYAAAASIAILLTVFGIQFFNTESTSPNMVETPDNTIDAKNLDSHKKVEIVNINQSSKNDQENKIDIDSDETANIEKQIIVQTKQDGDVEQKQDNINKGQITPVQNNNENGLNGNESFTDNQANSSTNNLSSTYIAQNNSQVSSQTASVRVSARIARNGNENLFIPHDTCVRSSFVYQLSQSVISIPNMVFEWNTNSETTSINIKEPGTYILHYWISDSIIGTDTMKVMIVEKPSPLLETGIEVCNHESVLLNSGLSDKLYDFKWSVSNLNKSEIYITQLEPGNQLVTLEVSSCVDTVISQVMIHVNDCRIVIPNVITPNNDGYNDAFIVKGLDFYPGSSLSILDRNGKLVFQSLDYKNDWKAENLEDGTYFYSLRINDKNKTEKGGIISVMRK